MQFIIVQQGTNGGKCGVCGDDYRLPTPRPHEIGGTYGNGVVVRKYYAGQVRQYLKSNNKLQNIIIFVTTRIRILA